MKHRCLHERDVCHDEEDILEHSGINDVFFSDDHGSDGGQQHWLNYLWGTEKDVLGARRLFQWEYSVVALTA